MPASSIDAPNLHQPRELCLIRGGGDLATGVAWRLSRAGFPVVVTELAAPSTVRRTVALSTAVTERDVSVEGMVGRLAATAADAAQIAYAGDVGVVVSEGLPTIDASVVIDARLAKRNIDTTIDDARLVVGLGPGFTAGIDCHAVVETLRGPRLGRCIWTGAAAADTGTPGLIGGQTEERVRRASATGVITWDVDIGTIVSRGQVLGRIGGDAIVAPFDGIVRGLILPGLTVPKGCKIADLDTRVETNVDEISDKALAVGGGVVEAVTTWSHGR